MPNMDLDFLIRNKNNFHIKKNKYIQLIHVLYFMFILRHIYFQAFTKFERDMGLGDNYVLQIWSDDKADLL